MNRLTQQQIVLKRLIIISGLLFCILILIWFSQPTVLVVHAVDNRSISGFMATELSTAIITPTQTITPTPIQLRMVGPLDLNQFTITENGLVPITPTPIPWNPTPAPHTIKVLTDTRVIAPPSSTKIVTNSFELPLEAQHFWFGRPFPDRGAWGSFQYPYGTNSKGNYLWHYGIDISGSYGNIIRAMGDGIVVHAGDDMRQQLGPWPDFYGQAVVIQHELWQGKPVFTLYGHASETLVQLGQKVQTNDPIARVGSGGVATGAHLHVEVRLGANTYSHTQNPDSWIKPDLGFGVIIGRVVDADGYFIPVHHLILEEFLPERAELTSETEDTVEQPEPVTTRKKYRRERYTYPNNEVNYDNQYQENFTFADVPIGDYIVRTEYNGHQLRIPVTVKQQSATFVLFQFPPKAKMEAEITPTFEAP